jgi:outer membrane protein, adhesin transport system
MNRMRAPFSIGNCFPILMFLVIKCSFLMKKNLVINPLMLLLGWMCAMSASASGSIGVADLTFATLSHHPSVRGAGARNQAAQLGVEAAKWQYWPTPSFGIERVQSGADSLGQADRTVGVLGFNQPLWNGGRLAFGLKRAEFLALQAEAETQEVRQLLATRVIQAWSDAVVAMRKIEAQNQSLEAHDRLLQMVERRHAEGASAKADVALARSRIDLLQADIEVLYSQRDAAMDKLRLLTDSQVKYENLVKSHELSALSGLTLADLLYQANKISPQIQKNQYLIEVARTEVNVAKASLKPELSLRVEHQQNSNNASGPSSENRIFISLNSNLGAGLSSLTGIGQAVAQVSAAEEESAVQMQALSEQVQLDWALIRAAKLRIRGLTLAAKAGEDVLESYERQFLAGRKQWIDLMNAAREQAQTKSQLADAMGAKELSSLRLILLSAGEEALLMVKPQTAQGKTTP